MGKLKRLNLWENSRGGIYGENLRGRIYGAMHILFKRWEILYEENFLMLEGKNFLCFQKYGHKL